VRRNESESKSQLVSKILKACGQELGDHSVNPGVEDGAAGVTLASTTATTDSLLAHKRPRSKADDWDAAKLSKSGDSLIDSDSLPAVSSSDVVAAAPAAVTALSNNYAVDAVDITASSPTPFQNAKKYRKGRRLFCLLQQNVFRPSALPSAALEQDSPCNVASPNETSGVMFNGGSHPLPFCHPTRRLAKICEHQRPRRFCLSCLGATNDDVQPPPQLISMPFDSAGERSASRAFKSCSPESAAVLLRRQVEAAAKSAAISHSHMKPSAPVRIACMSLLHDGTQCRMPGVFPDDANLWFCGLHKDRQKYGVVDQQKRALE
jgi:hypothetical protein